MWQVKVTKGGVIKEQNRRLLKTLLDNAKYILLGM